MTLLQPQVSRLDTQAQTLHTTGNTLRGHSAPVHDLLDAVQQIFVVRKDQQLLICVLQHLLQVLLYRLLLQQPCHMGRHLHY